ncbi:MAG: hypothetical protein RL329_3607 [Bacteroidota bacterium]
MTEDYLMRFIERSPDYQAGKNLYSAKSFAIQQQRMDSKTGKVTYTLPNGYQPVTQRVTIHDYDKPTIYAQCNCGYRNSAGMCEHIVAAGLKLYDSFHVPKFDASSVTIPNEPMTTAFLQRLSTLQVYSEGSTFANQKPAPEAEINLENQSVSYKATHYKVTFQRKGASILTSCACLETLSRLCSHKIQGFLYFAQQYGERPFEQIRDLTDEKNALLEDYGYDVNDERVQNLFKFKLEAGDLQLIVHDPSIHKILKSSNLPDLRAQVKQLAAMPRTREVRTIEPLAEEREVPILVYVIRWFPISSTETVSTNLTPFALKPLKRPLFEIAIRPVRALWRKDKLAGRLNEFLNDLRYTTFSVTDAAMLDEVDSKLFKRLQYFQEAEMGSSFVRKYYIGHSNPPSAIVHHPAFNDLTAEGGNLFEAKAGRCLQDIFQLLIHKKVYLANMPSTGALKLNDLQLVTVVGAPSHLEFRLFEQDGYCILEPRIRTGELLLDYVPSRIRQSWLYYEPQLQLLLFMSESSVRTLHTMFANTTQLRIRKRDLAIFLTQIMLPLMDMHNIQFDMPVDLNEGTAILSCNLYLTEATDKENDMDELIFTPIFTYESGGEIKELEYDSTLRQLVFENDGAFEIVYRSEEKENQIRAFFENLHPKFAEQSEANPSYFRLNVNELFENEWFFTAFEQIKAQNIEIFGFAQLTKIKYNPNRAKMTIKAASGIDWFDLEMSVSFGNEIVSLKEVRKALLNKQHYIKLSDGTLGILPQEWLEKYATAVKLGTVKGEKLKFSHFQFSLVEDLYAEMDDNEALFKLYEKKQLLKNFQSIADKPLPQGITAQLRSYQQSGYNWLCFLEEFKWGGILADDMGLGKTLQAIAFLVKQAEIKPDRQNLVIVPKSLVFNWQAECAKFAPSLTILVYYGQQRAKLLEDFKGKNLIISTYGAVRSDIERLSAIQFNYIVLDESQAIKNPDALMSKAVKLLKSDNRFALTGTPIENNTFDLYSQMDFLNPGMLGNMEYFKREFAHRIDRDKDVATTEQLKKLVYPFILRRTKEEVAKELPPKSESVIYCEMDPAQRTVYDSFRDKYRDAIMNRIDSDGMQNAAMYILEGLMKLRQICDSPAILNEPKDYGQSSVKLAELIPRISEDSGRHKILVFSQFLEMLNLIQKELTKLHIPYEYLDGKTHDRMERVNRFQENESCRVFLMSLKAGGVGLNLTAADYVYIVDPWWNPAVESQAIDRAHRIGQERPVFAYRMICKNTIEEKILELQDKKRALAHDLIHVEAGFVKGLKREDVMALFS